MSFELKHTLDDSNLIIKIIGDLDINSSPILKREVTELYEKYNKNILIDMEQLEYLDSTGLGALMSLYKKVKINDNFIKIVNVKKNIKKLFTITELDEIFNLE